MIKKLLLLLLVGIGVNTAAMAQYSVKCQVNDSTGTGEPYATVYIYGAADTAKCVVTGVTDGNGAFSQALTAAGKYVLRVSAVGKVRESRDFEVLQASPVANLGTIVIKASKNELKGIEVTAQKPLVKSEIDRLSYDVQGDGDSKTKTTLEMLRKVPMVTVDANDNIKVRGSGNFKIFKNGHPDPSLSSNAKDILKVIPANMIKRIEVITEPGAKYDAEGVSAILNIVMNDNTSVNGVTGTVKTEYSTNGRFGLGTFLTTQYGKFVTSINYGYNHMGRDDSRSNSNSQIVYKESGNVLTNNQYSDNRGDVHFGNIESSFEADTLNLLTLSFGGYYYDVDVRGSDLTSMFDGSGKQLYGYRNSFHMPSYSFYNFNGRFDYQHKTHHKDELLTLSYMLSTTHNKDDQQNVYSDTLNMPVPYSGYNQTRHEQFIEHTFQFDWERPFAKHHKIEMGVKYINRNNNSQTALIYDGEGVKPVNSKLDHLTQVAAAYTEYQFNMDKWTARAGLRYEYSYLRAKFPDGSSPNYHKNLNDLVPSASVNYKFSDANNLKFSYSTQISRPGISFLNPAVISTPTSVTFGNSNLGSSRSTSFGINFMHIGPKFTFNVNPSYTFANDWISDLQYVKDGKKYSTFGNILTYRNLSFSGYAQWQMFKGTSLMVNAGVNKEYDKNPSLGLKIDRWSSFYYSQLSQQLPLNINLTAGIGGNIGHAPNNVYGYGGTYTFYYLGLQCSMLKEKRLTVYLSANRPFSGKYMSYTSRTTQGDYTGYSTQRWLAREISIGISYRFGSLNASVKKTSKSIENNDVVGGLKSGGGNGGGGNGN